MIGLNDLQPQYGRLALISSKRTPINCDFVREILLLDANDRQARLSMVVILLASFIRCFSVMI